VVDPGEHPSDVDDSAFMPTDPESPEYRAVMSAWLDWQLAIYEERKGTYHRRDALQWVLNLLERNSEPDRPAHFELTEESAKLIVRTANWFDRYVTDGEVP